MATAELNTFEFLMDHLVEVDLDAVMSDKDKTAEKPLEPIHCETFEELNAAFDGALWWAESLEYTLATAIATHLSVQMSGEMLYVHILAPPSTGKSTIIDCILADKKGTFALSKTTGLYSGYKGTGQDEGLVPRINGKLLIFKDLTAMMKMSGWDSFLGELRDLSDGSGDTHFKNGEGKSYGNVNFGILTGVTDILRASDTSTEGDRFLVVDLTAPYHGSKEHGDVAITNTYAELQRSHTKRISKESPSDQPETVRKEVIENLRRKTLGFIEHTRNVYNTIPFPTITPWMQNKINALGQLGSFVRAKVHREKGDLKFYPRREAPTRLNSQLTKLAVCLAMVLRKRELDKEIYKIIRKILFDTISGIPFKAFQIIGQRPEGIEKKMLATALPDLTSTHVDRLIADFRVLKIITKQKSVKTNNTNRYFLAPTLRGIWDAVKDDPE